MTGINIQYPWSDLLINGLKCVETRTYPLPSKYEGVELALIETPGTRKDFKARIIGTITFSHCFEYPDEESWIGDINRHKVEINNKQYGWKKEKAKYGWVVSDIKKFDTHLDAPKNKGIIFTRGCDVKRTKNLSAILQQS